eukprot:4915810-Ditylum_brightwellii.AAC.1
MKHFVCTSAGESTEYYQHSQTHMKGGEGQGKTSSPPNWLFQSSTLLKLLEEQCTSLYITSVDKKYETEQGAEGYADNCDAGTADQQTEQSDTPAIITEKMRVIAQIWEDLIHGSGGEDSRASLSLVTDVKAQIYLTNKKSSKKVVLNRREPLEAILQLGP